MGNTDSSSTFSLHLVSILNRENSPLHPEIRVIWTDHQEIDNQKLTAKAHSMNCGSVSRAEN
ncbi:hypothetical protein FRX31_029622 [Thalictrum thalictroides]|uniref:Uncharacterized protein n=1 Tax=Thalictrum thalictroides TaxID=46969 RepID=A0A7J6V993_THATH|nr:hypothetical protein FRX31_029622 [Thalictrum thalictroides]